MNGFVVQGHLYELHFNVFEKIYLNKTKKKKDHHVIDPHIYFPLKCTFKSNIIMLNNIILDIQKTESLQKQTSLSLQIPPKHCNPMKSSLSVVLNKNYFIYKWLRRWLAGSLFVTACVRC